MVIVLIHFVPIYREHGLPLCSREMSGGLFNSTPSCVGSLNGKALAGRATDVFGSLQLCQIYFSTLETIVQCFPIFILL